MHCHSMSPAKVWSAVASVARHRFGWKTFPYAKNIQPFLTAPSILHRVVCAGAMSCRSPAKAVSPFVPHSATALHALSPHEPSQSMECGGKRSATPLWLETVPLCQKHPAVSNSAVCPPPCGVCRGHELPSPSQSGVGVRTSLCHRTPCIGLRKFISALRSLSNPRALAPNH
jgi:hypothetical protein